MFGLEEYVECACCGEREADDVAGWDRGAQKDGRGRCILEFHGAWTIGPEYDLAYRFQHCYDSD